MKKIKRRGLSWLLVMAMVLSGLALPNGQKAKAAEKSFDDCCKRVWNGLYCRCYL